MVSYLFDAGEVQIDGCFTLPASERESREGARVVNMPHLSWLQAQSVTGGPTARFEDLMGRFFGCCAPLFLFRSSTPQTSGSGDDDLVNGKDVRGFEHMISALSHNVNEIGARGAVRGQV